MKKKLIITVFFVFMLFLFNLSADTMEKINKEFVRIVDVTGDGKVDKIILHIKGENINAPFSWELTVKSKGEIIYRYFSNDKDIDKLFNEGWYENKNYIDSKKQWYFHDLINEIDIYNPAINENKTIDDELQRLVTAYLKDNYKFDNNKIKKIVANMIDRLKAGDARCLRLRISKEELATEMMFCEELNKFLPIWDEY